MGSRDSLVTLMERRGARGLPARPARLRLGRADNSELNACLRRSTSVHTYWLSFADRGQGFHVLVALGRGAGSQGRSVVRHVLNSLRFRTRPRGGEGG